MLRLKTWCNADSLHKYLVKTFYSIPEETK